MTARSIILKQSEVLSIRTVSSNGPVLRVALDPIDGFILVDMSGDDDGSSGYSWGNDAKHKINELENWRREINQDLDEGR